VSPAVIDAVRTVVAAWGPAGLRIDDLRPGDLDRLGWSGSPLHLKSVASALKRASGAEVDYMVVRAPCGVPVAKGAVDHADRRGPGKLWQLVTHAELRGLGIGTWLIRALEGRIQKRGITVAWISVEANNTRARRLYERLGYVAYGQESGGWEEMDPSGRPLWYGTSLILMRRPL